MKCKECDYTGDDFYTTTLERLNPLLNVIESINLYSCPECYELFVGKKK